MSVHFTSSYKKNVNKYLVGRWKQNIAWGFIPYADDSIKMIGANFRHKTLPGEMYNSISERVSVLE